VHQGLLSPDVVRGAMAAANPVEHLIAHGHVTAEQWDDWVATDGGVRPQLTRYELGDLLGEGGMARVFEATDRSMGDVTALKVLKPALCKDPTTVAQFIAEARLLIELDCEHIVAGHRVAREGEVIYCEMELLEGRCLQDDLAEDNPMPELEALAVVVQVGKALDYLHSRRLVHRDIKPGNIILCADGRAVLIDLGFAVGGDRESVDTTSGDTTSGTVHYISPEQAKGAGDLDVRADIYSLGCTLYHLVTGSLPFEGDSNEEVMARQILDNLSDERIRNLGLSQHTHFFIEKMMAKEKEIRFQSPAELIADIEAYIESVEQEAKRNQAGESKSKERRGRTLRSRESGRSPRRSSGRSSGRSPGRRRRPR
jgi:eukaryotic-like serine/threonine-protein kinase